MATTTPRAGEEPRALSSLIEDHVFAIRCGLDTLLLLHIGEDCIGPALIGQMPDARRWILDQPIGEADRLQTRVDRLAQGGAGGAA